MTAIRRDVGDDLTPSARTLGLCYSDGNISPRVNFGFQSIFLHGSAEMRGILVDSRRICTVPERVSDHVRVSGSFRFK